MHTALTKEDYLDIYNHSYYNASDLYEESKLLFNNNHYSRSYFLSFTALEEISKAMHSADIFTEQRAATDFYKSFTDHNYKIKNIKWAHKDANAYPYNLIWVGPNKNDFESIAPNEPLWEKRQQSLFVDLNKKEIYVPKNKINKDDARGIMHIVDTALYKIWEATVYWKNSIGTKGLSK